MEAIKYKRIVKVGCGIDVYQKVIVATIQKGDELFETRAFSAYTSSLTSLGDWCKSEGVAM